MTAAQFYTFLTGGLGLLVAIGLAIAWLLWREADARKDAAKAALDGVGHEFRINLQRMAAELSGLSAGLVDSANGLLPIVHPQLDGVNASMINTDRNALAVMGASYQELTARKLELRSALAQGHDVSAILPNAIDGVIDAIATLYMWEAHGGARPNEARETRSWEVRDWMKGHGFAANLFPDMHLRDEVVERLRVYGLDLTPKPLTHTASEYYAMQYDRQADPRGVFGRRKFREKEPGAPEVHEEGADTAEEIAAPLQAAETVEIR